MFTRESLADEGIPHRSTVTDEAFTQAKIVKRLMKDRFEVGYFLYAFILTLSLPVT